MDTTINRGGRGGRTNGEFCCGYLHFSKPNLTLVVLYSLVIAAGLRRWTSSPDCGGVGRQLWGPDGIGRGETFSAGDISFFVFPFLSKFHIADLPSWPQCLFLRRPPLWMSSGTAPLEQGCGAAWGGGCWACVVSGRFCFFSALTLPRSHP